MRRLIKISIPCMSSWPGYGMKFFLRKLLTCFNRPLKSNQGTLGQDSNKIKKMVPRNEKNAKPFLLLICFILVFLVPALVLIALIGNSTVQSFHIVPIPNNNNNVVRHSSNSISFGAVSCRTGEDMGSIEEVVVMIKSILISAWWHGVPRVDFHVFLEHSQDRKYIQDELAESLDNSRLNLEFHLVFHDAMAMIPNSLVKNITDAMPNLRCGYNRIFIPRALPNLDSIIYFDTDVLITGNVFNLWHFFSKMDPHQFIGMAARNDTFRVHAYRQDDFHLLRSLNSGMLLLNLTKLREFDWERRLIDLFHVSAKSSKEGRVLDQQLLDSFIRLHPEILYVLPCNYNFAAPNCMRMFPCRAAEDQGIQVLHGAGKAFSDRERPPQHNVTPGTWNANRAEGVFRYLFEQYQRFNLSQITKERVLTELMLPVKNSFGVKPAHEPFVPCYQRMNQQLFKEYLCSDMNCTGTTTSSK